LVSIIWRNKAKPKASWLFLLKIWKWNHLIFIDWWVLNRWIVGRHNKLRDLSWESNVLKDFSIQIKIAILIYWDYSALKSEIVSKYAFRTWNSRFKKSRENSSVWSSIVSKIALLKTNEGFLVVSSCHRSSVNSKVIGKGRVFNHYNCFLLCCYQTRFLKLVASTIEVTDLDCLIQ